MTDLNRSYFLDEQSSATHFLPGLLCDVSYISAPSRLFKFESLVIDHQ